MKIIKSEKPTKPSVTRANYAGLISAVLSQADDREDTGKSPLPVLHTADLIANKFHDGRLYNQLMTMERDYIKAGDRANAEYYNIEGLIFGRIRKVERD